MVTDVIGKGGKYILDGLVYILGKARINPNLITLFGLVINCFAAVAFAQGRFVMAGWILFFAGMMDMLDGAVARTTNSITDFGGFFDSVIDRYSDLTIFIGLIIYYGTLPQPRMDFVILTGVGIMGSVMTSYARARAECIPSVPLCKVGFLERPERVVLFIIGAWFLRMEHVLWAIAVLSNWTVISRILFTYRELGKVNLILPMEPDTGRMEVAARNQG